MQNRYVGDIGDYVKLALLRALSPGMTLGVAWWLYPDEARSGDGGHIKYLSAIHKWRSYDPILFDSLAEIVGADRRVGSIEAAKLLQQTVFHSVEIPTRTGDRAHARTEWFQAMKRSFGGCNLLFIDPDNGLPPEGYNERRSTAGKSVTLEELLALRTAGRTLVVYHHLTRRRGGHEQEIRYWLDRLSAVGFRNIYAIRARPFSPRAFFLLDTSPDIRQRGRHFAQRWHPHIEWFP